MVVDEYQVKDDLIRGKIKSILDQYNDEYPSGRIFIKPQGLIKIANLIGINYSMLSNSKRKEFRQDCIDTFMSGMWVKNKNYYTRPN